MLKRIIPHKSVLRSWHMFAPVTNWLVCYGRHFYPLFPRYSTPRGNHPSLNYAGRARLVIIISTLLTLGNIFLASLLILRQRLLLCRGSFSQAFTPNLLLGAIGQTNHNTVVIKQLTHLNLLPLSTGNIISYGSVSKICKLYIGSVSYAPIHGQLYAQQQPILQYCGSCNSDATNI